MNKPAEKITDIQPINERDFGPATQHYLSFSASVPACFEEADIENPQAWLFVARRMQAGSELRVMANDLSWVAYCIVMSVTGNNAQIKVKTIYVLDKKDEETAESRFEVKWFGPRKFGYVNKATGDVLKDNIPSKLQAMAELDDYLKALAR